jgi:hypothetical protein
MKYFLHPMGIKDDVEGEKWMVSKIIMIDFYVIKKSQNSITE